jgi:hypothetical protein
MPKRIDLRHSITALAILQIGSLLQGLEPGEALEILGGEEQLIEDLERVLHDCVVERTTSGQRKMGKGCRFLVRKQHSI